MNSYNISKIHKMEDVYDLITHNKEIDNKQKIKLYEDIQKNNKVSIEFKLQLEFLIRNSREREGINFYEEFVKEIQKIENKQDKLYTIECRIAEIKTLHTYCKGNKNIKYPGLPVKIQTELTLLDILKEETKAIPENSTNNDSILYLETFPSKLLLFIELDILDVLKNRIKENAGSQTDLIRLLSYLTNSSPDNVKKYLQNELPGSPGKNHPYSHESIQKLHQVLRECNIKPKKDYEKILIDKKNQSDNKSKKK